MSKATERQMVQIMKLKEMLNSLFNLCNRELNNNHKTEDEAIESAKRIMQNEINIWFRVGIGTTKQLIQLRNLFDDIIKCFDKVGE